MTKIIKFSSQVENILRKVGELFQDAGEDIFIVGGAVRDLLTDKEPHDIDFTTSAGPRRLKQIVRPAAKQVFDKSRAKGYGTHGVILEDGTEVEITPYRRTAGTTEGSTGKVTLEKDLKSRDFTINSIAIDVTPDRFAKMVDVCGGLDDLKSSRLRTPLPPIVTFKDDPIRPLRAARFTAQLGLEPDTELLDAIKHVLKKTDWLSRVAAERVREELLKMLMHDPPSVGFRIMQEWGILDFWLPEVSALAKMEPDTGMHHKDAFQHTMVVLDKAAEFGPPNPVFRFATLLHDIGKPNTRQVQGNVYSFPGHEKAGADLAGTVCERLRWSNNDTSHIMDLIRKHHRLHGYTPEWTDSAVRRALHDLGEKYEEIIALARSDISSAEQENVDTLMTRVNHFEGRVENLERQVIMDPSPPIDGDEVMRLLGMPPGPKVGHVIKFLKDCIISGKLDHEDADSARRLVLGREWE